MWISKGPKQDLVGPSIEYITNSPILGSPLGSRAKFNRGPIGFSGARGPKLWAPESPVHRNGRAPVILASCIGEHTTVQNKATPTGPYEAKAQSCSHVHIVNYDYQSLVISVLCNPGVITYYQVLSVINRQSILNARYVPFFSGI